MMPDLTASELKTHGVSAIEKALEDQPEASISVRGEPRYVVMELAQYDELRESEMSASLAESHADREAGRVVCESVDAHLERLSRKEGAGAMKDESLVDFMRRSPLYGAEDIEFE
ncbi:hypothetical protein [Spiribacter onubensis]|uniref:Antitoxin n=1 Tax=Spiribacter onubensis TaxID=3122420 RepID=A0ABV3SB43_9GAMM